MNDFIGPQLPPDDVLYRRRISLSREVFRHRTHVLKAWLRKKAEDQPARYLGDDYYVKNGVDGRVISVRDYLGLAENEERREGK